MGTGYKTSTFDWDSKNIPANYSKVDEAIAKAEALNKDNYKDFSAVEAAVNAVVRDKNITEQSEVDAMAKAIEDAIAALQYKDADYTKVDAAIAKANALTRMTTRISPVWKLLSRQLSVVKILRSNLK